MKPWVGVDLDGTLAIHEPGQTWPEIGKPVPAMVERVKAWLAEGIDVRIVTARVGFQRNMVDIGTARMTIGIWCKEHLGQVLPVTCEKDYDMIQLWDDRCVTVEKNTGRILTEGIS